MADDWPSDDAFKTVVCGGAKTTAEADVRVSVSETKSGVLLTVSIAASVANDIGLKDGGRYRLSSTRTADALFLRFTASEDGGACLTIIGGRSPAADAVRRRQFRVFKLEALDLPGLSRAAVDWVTSDKGLTLRLPLTGSKPVARRKQDGPPTTRAAAVAVPARTAEPSLAPAEAAARKLARKLASEGSSDKQILDAIEDQQNAVRNLAWLDDVLERVE